jgi:multidrug efflux system membrane fusion protein
MTRRRVVAIALAAGIGGLIWWRIQADNSRLLDRTAKPPIETTTARLGSAPLELSAMGQVLSSQSVSVRAQVSGALTRVYFTEGADVKAGDKLFDIDAAPYQAAVAQARAQLARDRAAAEAAKSQYDRLAPLAKNEYASAQEIENARAAAAQAAAVVQADQAAVQQLLVNLDRTGVTAPIAGRTGSLSVKIGNVVSPSDATPIVVINQLNPVQIDFAIPQSQLNAVQEALARGAVPARVTGEQPGEVLGQGKLVFVDNAVSPTTGTVRLKVEVDNSKLRLWPGAFVTVTLTLKIDQDVVLVPELAVQAGAEGSYVFTVDATGVVAVRNVTVARQVGADMLIADGLKAGDLIVARPPRGLSPGMNVHGGQRKGSKPAAQ